MLLQAWGGVRVTPYLKKPWMTAGEYRANLQGLNVFFGAVLGVVMAGTERLPPFQYGIMLLLMASLVITILYISSSPKRLLYSAMILVGIAVMPRIVSRLVDSEIASLPYLQVTLLVWALLAIMIEFAPRERETVPATTIDD